MAISKFQEEILKSLEKPLTFDEIVSDIKTRLNRPHQIAGSISTSLVALAKRDRVDVDGDFYGGKWHRKSPSA